MDSNAPLEQSAPSAPHFSSEGQDQIANKKSHNKTIIILLSIFSIIATAAAVVFGVMYFTNQKPTDQPTPETSVQEEETEQAAEETEITDENLKKDLDEKISILFNTDFTGASLTAKGIGLYDEKLFHDGDIGQSEKVRSVIKNALQLEALNEQEINAAVAQSGLTGEDEKTFRNFKPKGIKGGLVAQRYREIFGKDFEIGPISVYCGEYEYNAQYNFYYDAGFGCGGTTPIQRLYYKNHYVTDSNHAYVYVSAGFLAPTFGISSEGYVAENPPYNIYCDIANSPKENSTEISDSAKICESFQDPEESAKFTINESNYQQFAQYRFVFDRANDGNYYFDKVEKIDSE